MGKQTHREVGHVKTEAEIRGSISTLRSTMDCWQP